MEDRELTRARSGISLTRSKTAIFDNLRGDLAAAREDSEDSDGIDGGGQLHRPHLPSNNGGTTRHLGGADRHRRETRLPGSAADEGEEGDADHLKGLRSAASLRRMQALLPPGSGAGKRKHKHKRHHKRHKHGHGHGHGTKKKHSHSHKKKHHHSGHSHHRRTKGKHHGDRGHHGLTLSEAAHNVMRMGGAMRGLGLRRGGGLPPREELTRPLRRASLLAGPPPAAPPKSARLRASRLSRSARPVHNIFPLYIFVLSPYPGIYV